VTPRIFIAIPVHHRLEIAKQCIPTVHAGMVAGDRLALFNDGTGTSLPMDLLRIAGALVHDAEPLGIERQRQMHFRLFSHLTDYTHLYLTDQDALHDPEWRRRLLELQDYVGGAPVCGYNTEAHAKLVGNTLHAFDLPGPVIWRAVAPGISYLLTRAHVEKVVANMPENWNWDWTVPALLGNRMAIARESVVDHIGHGGMHHPAAEGLEGGDRALNPTPWLVAKRAAVIKQLSAAAWAKGASCL
jgi:hypothetical protein